MNQTCSCGRWSYDVPAGHTLVKCPNCLEDNRRHFAEKQIHDADDEIPAPALETEVKVSIAVPTVKIEKPKSDKAQFCPECGGPSSRGRGWIHTNTCSMSTANRLLAQRAAFAAIKHLDKCPDCNGPRFKKGFKHEETCPRRTSPVKQATA
jgi:hypothetical protein